MPGGIIQASFPRGVTPLRPHVAPPPPLARPRAPSPATHAIQRRGSGQAFQLPDGFALRRGTGQPLPAAVRQRMEHAMSADFSAVRVHIGHEAAAIGALAFTHGTDIYFARGQYNPHSRQGQNLLGHELAHVVQQRSGRVRNPFGSGVAVVQDHALEAEADRMAERLSAAPPPARHPPTAAGAARRNAFGRPQASAIVRRSAVQRRMELDPSNIGMNQLAWRLAYAARSHNWPPILGNSIDQEKRILEANLTEMASFPENYGTFDVTDDQHLALLYFEVQSFIRRYVRTGNLEAARKILTAPKPAPAVFELAFIGAASTTAYYIDTLGPHYDHSTTLLFGETQENPWAKQRGFTIDFINHARRQIDLPSRNTNEYPKGARSTGMFVKREAFAKDAAAVIANAIPAERCIADPVVKNGISRDDSTHLFTIVTEHKTTKAKTTYTVKKVVFAAGAGGHKAPGYKGDGGKTFDLDMPLVLRSKVMDMDTFIRDRVDQNPKGTVIVMGPNAAIDAVAAAKYYDWTVVWFAGSPAFLPGTFYMDEPYKLQDVRRADAVHVEAVDHGGKLTVYYCDQVKTGGDKHERADACSRGHDDVKRKHVANVDLIVYGIGPAGSLSSLLSKELAAELEPAYDENVARPTLTPLSKQQSEYVDKRRRNEVTEDKVMEEQIVAWYKSQESAQAFVGLTARKHKLAKEHRGVNRRAKSSSLIVLGAAAEAEAKSRPDPRNPDPHHAAGIAKVRGGVSSDVLTIGQLTYIRAAVMTHNRYVPPSVGKRVDYGHATPDILRAHFAAKYSDIGDGKLDPGDTIASGAIKIIMTLARDRRIPHGYTPDQERIIAYWLGVLNACFRARDSVGTMRVWLTRMGNQLIDSIAKARVNPTYLTWLQSNETERDAFKKEQQEKRYALATLGLTFTFDDSYK